MKPKNVILVVLGVVVVAALFLANRTPEQPAATTPAPAPQTAPSASTPAQPVRQQPDVPPYHPSAEAARPLPKTLPASLFPHPAVAKAYGVAERIPEVLAQQPCYCWCNKFGHGSLLDCYKTDHGAG